MNLENLSDVAGGNGASRNGARVSPGDPAKAHLEAVIRGAVASEAGRAIRKVRRALRAQLERNTRRVLEECRRDADRLCALLSRAVTPGGNGETHTGCQPPAAEPPPEEGARHGEDFRSVYWFGTAYSFTPTQAAVVRVLWKAWTNKTPEVGHETLLRLAGSECGKLSSLFQGSPAWGTVIMPGATKGSFRLADPPGLQGE